jgi:hypothetical protein
MRTYDPEKSPDAKHWLASDEGERIALVSDYHRRKRISMPAPELHAVIHVIVENQLALGDAVVLATLGRLVADGLSRHDAIHAIGSVLAEYLYELLRDSPAPENPIYAVYLERLKKFSAKDWLDSAR